MTSRVFWIVILAGTVQVALGQKPELDAAMYLSRIEAGHADEVRRELPSLLTKYPNNPGVLYIQGLTTADGAEAVRIYQSIVDNFPKSEWADDALFKVYQFYYAIGLYRTAELKMDQLKKDYPDSRYAARNPDEANTARLAEEPQPVIDSVEASAAAVAGEPVDDQPPGQTTPQPSFGLQVGAYGLQVNAEKQKLFFEDLSFPVEVINRVKDSRSLYLVVVGHYDTYEAAKTRAEEIKKAYNIDSIVISR